jgi:hypothetical protein
VGIYDIEVLEFEFFPYIPDGVTKPGSDPNVAYTITNLIRDVFDNPLRVVVYLCDSSDGFHRGRHRLFEGWHKGYMDDFLLRIPLELELTDENHSIQQVFGCILVRTDFPHMDVLQEQLIDEAAGIISSKYM